MAKNDRNNQRGKLGELRVAQALVKTGCVVNFLSFMDVGLDLHVQVPIDLKMPDQKAFSWKISGQAAHVQVKSTKTNKLPPISRETARTWNLGAQAGIPTIVVAVAVDSDGHAKFMLFDPLLIKQYVDKSRGESFTIPLSRGTPVKPKELFGHLAHWVANGRYYLAEGVSFQWPMLKADAWEAAIQMVCNLALIHESSFYSPSISANDYEYAKTAVLLMEEFLEGAGMPPDVLHKVSNNGQNYLEKLEIRAAEKVQGACTQDGWSSWVKPLAMVSPEYDKEGALNFLSKICRAYGETSRGSFKMPA